MKPVKFNSKVEQTDSSPPWHILRVPRSRVSTFGFKGNLRRVICTLNGRETLNCSLFPSKGDYFITLSKALRKSLQLEVGDTVRLELCKDESKFGMPMPAEFAEVLRQDPEGERLFNEMSPGNQRLMLKLVVFAKDTDLRIARSLAGIKLLKITAGKFEYQMQHDAMRIVSSTKKLNRNASRMRSENAIKFSSVLTKSTGEYGGYYIPVPARIAKKFEKQNGTRRVVCKLNEILTFQCAVLPNAKGFYIGTNKAIRDRLGLAPGSRVTVEIRKDESKYGLPMPKELREVLKQDPEGDRLFHELTPGKQRSMLYSVARHNDVDKRIHYALVIIDHLKANEGKIVYEKLKEEIKRAAIEI